MRAWIRGRSAAGSIAVLAVSTMLTLLASALAGCGGATPPAAPSPAPSPAPAGPSTQPSHGMGHGTPTGMNSGDPNAVPADQIPAAGIVGGPFQLLDTAPVGYEDTAGTALLARHPGGTTVTVRLTGLRPGVAYIAHVHSGDCAQGGGEHYRFDPAGGDMPPNEIHLAFTSAPDGSASMTAENDRQAGPQARSVVVHPVELMDNKIACAPLT